jgi:hypothetical protein
MTGFGILFMAMALVHDFWGPPQPLNRVLWPYALIALSFYVGLDVMFAGIAEAWEKFKQAKIEAKMARED